jgi:hypothetical protein
MERVRINRGLLIAEAAKRRAAAERAAAAARERWRHAEEVAAEVAELVERSSARAQRSRSLRRG